MDSLSLAKKISIGLILLMVIFLLYISRSIIKPIFISILMAYILNPLVKLLMKRGLKKQTSVLIVLFLFVAFFLITIFYVVPGIIKDVLGILNNLDIYKVQFSRYIEGSGYDKMPPYLKNVIDENLIKLQDIAIKYLNDFFKYIISTTMELPAYSLAPVLIYYFLIDSDYFIVELKNIIPLKWGDRASEIWKKIDILLGSFIRSQIILSLIVSVLTFIAMVALRVKYPLIIAFINGITNLIPYFGPIIGFIPAFFAALTDSMNKVIIVAIVFLIIQQFESSVIAPKLMGDSMGIHPVYIMIIIILGGKYFGGWGLLLSVPIAGIIKVIFNYTIRNLY